MRPGSASYHPWWTGARLEPLAPVLFPQGYDEQRGAAVAAARQWTTVLTGGPGTGKTTAVAGLLALLADQSDRRLRIALTAPTGKAAARLQEAVRTALAEPRFADHAAAVGDPTAQTLHRLLGWKRGSRNRFRHDRRNRLPHDVIVVDETSMVSLTMMARLVEAVRADCRLILVGDPDQLASVEAGAVLADLVDGLARREPATVASLRESHRFGRQINDLAEAVKDGDADRALALLTAGGAHIELLDPDDPDHPAGAPRRAWLPTRWRCGTRLPRATPGARSPCSTSTASCAPIATDRGASATGTARSSGVSPSTPACRSAAAGARSGTSGVRSC